MGHQDRDGAIERPNHRMIDNGVIRGAVRWGHEVEDSARGWRNGERLYAL